MPNLFAATMPMDVCGGRRKNEVVHLGLEICGKLLTKAQEKSKGCSRSYGTVPGLKKREEVGA